MLRSGISILTSPWWTISIMDTDSTIFSQEYDNGQQFNSNSDMSYNFISIINATECSSDFE